ncbi:MAG: metallophosphoesterase [Lentisphaeria bacterium]
MLILIADSHLAENTSSHADFIKLLEWISSSPYDVCFLGDIMELWIALPKFEGSLHQKFLAWCGKESTQRKIYLLEGNHEFFVAARYAKHFTRCAGDSLQIGNDFFCHGDLIQRHQCDHLIFRRISKSRFAFFLLRFLPGILKLVSLLQSFFQKKSRHYNKHLPLPEICHWLEQRKAKAGENIFLGHFHQAYQEMRKDGTALFCLPAWKENQEIALFDPVTRCCTFLPWQQVAELPIQPKKESER